MKQYLSIYLTQEQIAELDRIAQLTPGFNIPRATVAVAAFNLGLPLLAEKMQPRKPQPRKK